MDEQNYGNQQNGESGTGSSSGNYYQDYTANTQQYQPPQNGGPNKANGMQIAGLVLGILGIPGCCCYGVLGLLLGIIGLILALVGNSKNKGSGIGIAGLVCSIIAIIFGILMTVYFAWYINMVMNSDSFMEMMQEMMEYYY
ncbi:MAG: hypothetical protein NC123_00655 [Butyrivibrio sp.]|nr:hypothetical protein [Acetatifactor muris]MCM1558045.1 hypothetical protein [Butyrivibrio sp.]